MTTQKQLQANRANARKSTGPSSKVGKSRSSHNSMKHGLTSRQIVIGNEDPVEFDQLRECLLADFLPQTGIESELVDRLAGYLWRLRRVPILESALMRMQLNAAQRSSEMGRVDQLSDAALLRLMGLVKTALVVKAQEKSENASSEDVSKIDDTVDVGTTLTSSGGNIDDFGKLSRYESALLSNATRVLSLLNSLRNSGLLAQRHAIECSM